MIDLISTLHMILDDAGFEARLTPIGQASVVSFEDETIIGFGWVFDTPDTLLAEWKAAETAILKRYAPTLRNAGDKAWNVYCVFLCGRTGDRAQGRQVRWIEEDLERTRKIAASGLASRDDVVRALLPILPLQYQPMLGPENLAERMKSRIDAIAPRAAQAILDDSIPPAEVLRLLGGQR